MMTVVPSSLSITSNGSGDAAAVASAVGAS
jgi:hypothetical protein